MRKDWLPVMYFCFIGVILSKACRTKFSNTAYDIFLFILKKVMSFLWIFHYQNFYSQGMWLYIWLFSKLVFENNHLQTLGSQNWTVLTFGSLCCLWVSIRSMLEGRLNFCNKLAYLPHFLNYDKNHLKKVRSRQSLNLLW